MKAGGTRFSFVPVGYGFRLNSELLHHASFIAHDIASAVELSHLGTGHTLAEVFVRRTDENHLDSHVPCAF